MLLNKKIPVKYILGKSKNDLIFIFSVCITINTLIFLNPRILPDIPVAIPAFLGTAISLILSFKLNQAYDRWWEARKIWGAIVNDSRSLALQINSFHNNNDSTKPIKYIQRQIAWCYALTASLRKQDALEQAKIHLSEFDCKEVEKHSNIPFAIMSLNAKELALDLKKGELDKFLHIQIDDSMVRLVASMGKAERIKNTVFPKTYSLFLHGLIYIFIIMLSISVAEVSYLYEIVIVFVIATPFVLLEKTAEHMQDPFENRPSDTAMTAICNTIEVNLKELIDQKKNITSFDPETASFYTL